MSDLSTLWRRRQALNLLLIAGEDIHDELIEASKALCPELFEPPQPKYRLSGVCMLGAKIWDRNYLRAALRAET